MRKFTIFALMAVISFGLLVSQSFAAQITVETNKETYGPGDRVKLTGVVEGGVVGDFVAVEIKSPSGETILIRTVELGPGGTYDLEFKIPSSGETGNYEIISNAKVGGEIITETKTISQSSQPSSDSSSQGGGCLIATATFGSELAPQVQMLREIRDNSLLQTQSGQYFMQGFNEFYYSFSPTIADYERENPIFKEAVKLTITPLLASLSILNYVDLDSEESVLGYGIGIILMNVGMYFVAPAIVISKIRKLKI